jgi:hypothetical protein
MVVEQKRERIDIEKRLQPRRLSQDHERHVQTSGTLLDIAAIRLMPFQNELLTQSLIPTLAHQARDFLYNAMSSPQARSAPALL